MFEKYILLNPDKYKASFEQQKSSGKLFFNFSVNAGSRKELFYETEEVLKGLTKIANDYNKETGKSNKDKKPPVKDIIK